MKKIIFAFLIAISATGFAQPNPPQQPPAPPPPPDPQRREKMESMKIAFLTQKLDLTPDEAQKFWPVYNEFQKKREELRKKRREETKSEKGNLDSLSDKQIEAFVDGEMSFRQKNLDLEKEYHGKFKSVLPIRKVAKLYRAEDMFAHHLLQQISDRGTDGDRGGRKKGMMQPPGPPDPPDNH
jgi:Spy/CpxP family protein refolding chaperone